MLKKNVSSRVVEDAYDDDPIDCVNFSHLDTDDFLEVGCFLHYLYEQSLVSAFSESKLLSGLSNFFCRF